MDRKTGYRRFLLWCLGIDLLAIGILGYRYMDRKVPDEIHITRGDRVQEAEIFSHPLLVCNKRCYFNLVFLCTCANSFISLAFSRTASVILAPPNNLASS